MKTQYRTIVWSATMTLTLTAKWLRSVEHRSDASFVHSLYIQQTCNNRPLLLLCLLGKMWEIHCYTHTITRVKLKLLSRRVLTVQGLMCHFSSFQIALLISCCGKKKDDLVHSNSCDWNFSQNTGQGENIPITLQDNRYFMIGPLGQSNLRLWLCWVIPQGHTVPLDLIEALFTEMIPVGNKAIFRWTAASTHSSSTGKPAHRWQNVTTEDRAQAVDRWKDTHTHRQRYRLVMVEMVMIQSLLSKLEKKQGNHAKMPF